jgi:hypothetical protein
MTPAERATLRLDWLVGTTAEIERRQAAKLEAAGGDERERFIATLQQMAERLAVAAARDPLQIDDMSIAEMLACRWFLPEELMPPGRGSEKEIWAEYAARQ